MKFSNKLFLFSFLWALIAILYYVRANKYKDIVKEEDLKNEFGDFDTFNEDDDFDDDVDVKVEVMKDDYVIEKPVNVAARPAEDLAVENIEDFDHFDDEDEFEGYDSVNENPKKIIKKAPEISIVQLPDHNYFNYYLEIGLLFGILVYFVNYIIGKNKNTEIVTAWFNANKSLLNDNFAFVGDDGKANSNGSNALTQESEHLYTLWCSGRTCCEGMLVELKFIKRQDLFSLIANYFLHESDQIHFKFSLSKEDMDSYVFCVAHKKAASKLCKELIDLSIFCPDRKPGEKYDLPSIFNIMSEIGEVSTMFLDTKTVNAFNKYKDIINYVHISDRYAGSRSPDEDKSKQPEHRRMLLIGFNIPDDGKSAEEVIEYMHPLMTIIFHWLEKIKRFRLSKEGKAKTDRNRTRIEEAFLKTTHVARNEAAAARKEEKKRKEKERIMMEEDPEKQRRLEEKELKKQMKKKTPKMKQLKVKSL